MDENKDLINEVEPEQDSPRKRIAKRRQARGGGSPWMVGLVLIAVGVVFLLQNTTGFYINNWWAFFILIPRLVPLRTPGVFIKPADHSTRPPEVH